MCISDISTSISTEFGNFTAIQISESLSGSLPTWRPLTTSGVVSCSYRYISASIQTKDRYNNCEDLLYMYVGTGSLSHHEMPRRRITTDDGHQFEATNDQKALVWFGGSTNSNAFLPIEMLPPGTKLVAWKDNIYDHVKITENRHLCNVPATASFAFKNQTDTVKRTLTLNAYTLNYPYSESKTYSITSSLGQGSNGQATGSEVIVFNTHNSSSLAENFTNAVNGANGHAGKLKATRGGGLGRTVTVSQTEFTGSTPIYNITNLGLSNVVAAGTQGIPTEFGGARHGYNASGVNSDQFDNWRCDSNGVSVDFTVGGTNSYQLKNGIVLKGFTGELCSCGPDATIFEYPCESSTSFCVSESIELRFSGSDTGTHKEWTVSDSNTGAEILSSNFIYSQGAQQPFGYTQSGNFAMQLGAHQNGTASYTLDLINMHNSASQWPAGGKVGPSNQMDYIFFDPKPNPRPTYQADWVSTSGSTLGASNPSVGQVEYWTQIGLTSSAPPYKYTSCINYGIFPTHVIGQIGANVTASAQNLAKAINDAHLHPSHSRWFYEVTASARNGKLTFHSINPGTRPNYGTAESWMVLRLNHEDSIGLGHGGNTGFRLNNPEVVDPFTHDPYSSAPFLLKRSFVSGANVPAPTHMTLSWFNSSSNSQIISDTRSKAFDYKLPQELNVCYEEAIELDGGLTATSSCCAFIQLNSQPYSTSKDNTACQTQAGFDFPMSELGLENYNTITYGLESGGGHYATASISMSYEATGSGIGITASNSTVFAKEGTFLIAANGVNYGFQAIGPNDIFIDDISNSTSPTYFYATSSNVNSTVITLANKINSAPSGNAAESIGNLVEAFPSGAVLNFSASNVGTLAHSFTFKTGSYETGHAIPWLPSSLLSGHNFDGGVNPSGSAGTFVINTNNPAVPYDVFMPDTATFQQGYFDIDFTASVSNSLCINSASNSPSFSAPLIPTITSTPGCCSDISGTITLVANPGLSAGKSNTVQCYPTMALSALGPLFNFPSLGQPTWSIAGATLNDGTIISDLNYGQVSFPSNKISFGKSTTTDSHSLDTELYLLDPNYCGMYTMSLAISNSKCSFTDTVYVKMVSHSLNNSHLWEEGNLNYCSPEALHTETGIQLTGPDISASGYWTHHTPPLPGTFPGYPFIENNNQYRTPLVQQAGSTCIYLWTEFSQSQHTFGNGQVISVNCVATATKSVTVDDNPGNGSFVVPNGNLLTVPSHGGIPPLQHKVFYQGGPGCCPAGGTGGNYYTSRSFEMTVPGLAINSMVTLSIFNNEDHGYNVGPANFQEYVMGFGSGSPGNPNTFNRVLHNSFSAFGFNSTNSAQSHSEDIMNTSNINYPITPYTSSHFWFRSEKSSSYGVPISMSFTVAGEMGVCSNETTAELVQLIPTKEFDISFHTHPDARIIQDPEFGIDCIKASNVIALSFQSGGFQAKSTQSTVVTMEGSTNLYAPTRTNTLGGCAPYITTSLTYCNDPSGYAAWNSVTDWMNSSSVVAPRYSWNLNPNSSSAATPNAASPYWPIDGNTLQPTYWSGSGIVTSSFGIALTKGFARHNGGNNAYSTHSSPLSMYGSLDGIQFLWNARLLMAYDANGVKIENSWKNPDNHGCFADTWKNYSHYESPTYFPPIRHTSANGVSYAIDGWPTGWGTDTGSYPSGPFGSGVYGAPQANNYYSASVMFSITASGINRPDLIRYASMSIMFVTQSFGSTLN